MESHVLVICTKLILSDLKFLQLARKHVIIVLIIVCQRFDAIICGILLDTVRMLGELTYITMSPWYLID